MMPDQLTFKVEAYETFNTSFTVADGTQISRGMLLQLTDPRTASKATGTSARVGADQAAAGIAAMEKEASDGSTKITAWRKGIFDSVASGAITVGKPVVFVADGYIAQAPIDSAVASHGVVGRALETASDAERIEWSINL